MIITNGKGLDEYLRDEGLEPDAIEDLREEFLERGEVEVLKRREL